MFEIGDLVYWHYGMQTKSGLQETLYIILNLNIDSKKKVFNFHKPVHLILDLKDFKISESSEQSLTKIEKKNDKT